MSYTTELHALLIRYTKDEEGLDITLEDLYKIPYWRCVWGWWKALAYYKIDHNYESIQDVPEGIEEYTIMADVLTSYYSKNGHKSQQIITKDECKAFYGSSL